MTNFGQKNLNELLNQPLPKISDDAFIENTINKYQSNSLSRFVILQLSSLLGFIALICFLPIEQLSYDLVNFALFEPQNINNLFLSSLPLILISMVFYFIKDEIN